MVRKSPRLEQAPITAIAGLIMIFRLWCLEWPEARGLEAARGFIHQRHLAAYQMLDAADLHGFHGQTLAHDPGGRGTHQLGDGRVLAQRIGKPVAWDFRSKDVVQGAPLAPFFHFACAQWAGLNASVAFLNLGGVGNLTWLDPRCAAPE